MLQRLHSGDGCDLASTLCKYDLRQGDLFVLSWVSVQQMTWGSMSSELLMCGGGVCTILFLPLVARCLATIDVCIWCMLVFMSVVVTVWGSVAVLNAAFYMTCRFLMLVEDARGDHMEEAYSRAGLMTAL